MCAIAKAGPLCINAGAEGRTPTGPCRLRWRGGVRGHMGARFWLCAREREGECICACGRRARGRAWTRGRTRVHPEGIRVQLLFRMRMHADGPKRPDRRQCGRGSTARGRWHMFGPRCCCGRGARFKMCRSTVPCGVAVLNPLQVPWASQFRNLFGASATHSHNTRTIPPATEHQHAADHEGTAAGTCVVTTLSLVLRILTWITNGLVHCQRATIPPILNRPDTNTPAHKDTSTLGH